MNTFVNHVKTAIQMYKNDIYPEFIENYSINEIVDCCNRIEENNISVDAYKWSEIIQEEMIKNGKFISYLNEVYEKKINMNSFQRLLKDLKKHNENMIDYPMKSVIDVLSNEDLYYQSYYDYLKYFRDEDIALRKRITNNLNHFHNQSELKFNQLSDKERELLKKLDLSNYNLIPINDIKAIYELLANNKELIKLIKFLNARKLYICLDKESYEIINSSTKEIREYIEIITNKIKNDDITYQMLSKWVENGCKLYDLKKIDEKIANIKLEKLETAFYNRSSYVNFIYGNKLKKFPLNEIYGVREKLIIYAISNNKKNFVKLIEEKMEEFLAIPSNSILYHEKFYTTYININEITLNYLTKLHSMVYSSNSNIDELREQRYTFEEINTLYEQQLQYIELYNKLLELKVDDRLLRIRQFIKKDLLRNINTYSSIEKLAERIKIKPLYFWLENEFNRIEDINAEDAIKMLAEYETIYKFIPEVTKDSEVKYILRNLDRISDYDNFENMKEDIENIDSYWIKLKNKLNFSNEFTEKYKENIKEFLLNNGSELAYTYYLNCNEENQKSFKLIIKAQLMGEFKKLKYHTSDLEKELGYELNSTQINEWTTNNSKIVKGKYEICEYDDFYHTMILGEYPKTTCLSYKNGGYNRCLLACFDSNKKILYAKLNGKIVGRAMVRLTKGTFNKEKSNEKELNFIDLEDEKQNKEDEKLTLFLERPYISGVTDEETKVIKKSFINLLRKKAKLMNALLVLSYEYNREIDEQFEEKEYYIYISKSKSSAQYLDSLGGQATVEKEGHYKANYFFIEKQIEDEESIFEESIFQEAS